MTPLEGQHIFHRQRWRTCSRHCVVTSSCWLMTGWKLSMTACGSFGHYHPVVSTFHISLHSSLESVGSRKFRECWQQIVYIPNNRICLPGKGYEVHTNNWYTYPCLFHYLQGQGVDVIGMVRVNCKNMLKELQVKACGDVDYHSSGTTRRACRAFTGTTRGPS